MSSKQYVMVPLLSAGLLMFGTQTFAGDIIRGVLCEYELGKSAGVVGEAKVKIYREFLEVRIDNGVPGALYTVWVDFRNRAKGKALSDDYPQGATLKGVPPASLSLRRYGKVWTSI